MTSTIPTTSGIYRITCIPTGKIYIGSAINLRDRQRCHFKELLHNKHHNPKLQNSYRKYGEQAFVFEVLELVLFPELLTMREQYWFDKLNPFGKRGFNICPIAGSNLGKKESPETIERKRLMGLGRKHTLEARANMSAAQKGRTHTKETKEKMRIAALGHTLKAEGRTSISRANLGNTYNVGRKHTPETRANMSAARETQRKTLIVTAPDGTEQIIHGIRAFCSTHNLDHSALRKVAIGKQSNHKGWKARYM